MYSAEFRRFLGANTLNDTAQYMSFTAITFLALQHGGLASVSIVQSVPLLYRILGVPWVAALTDRWPPRAMTVWIMAALALAALGGLWFHIYWYAAILTVNAVLLTSFTIAYARLLPGIVAAHDMDRAVGAISMLTNIARLASAAAGPYLAYHIGTGVFVLVAALHALASFLFWTLPRHAGQGNIDAPALASPHTRGRLFLGIGHLFRQRARALVVILIMLSSVCLGIEEVVAMPIAQNYLHVPDAWLGAYPAMGSAGAIAGAMLMSKGLLTSSRALVYKFAALLMGLAVVVGCLLLTASPVMGFALKTIEGLVWALMGLLAQSGLVLSAAAELRGRLQALLVSCTAAMLLAGKAVAGALAGVVTEWSLYAGASAIAGALALLVMGLHMTRGMALVPVQPKEKQP